MFHTAAWPDDVELDGKRVALIGTGSSGSQLMPFAAEHASKLVVFQRSPNWIAPEDRYKRAVPPEVQWLFDNLPYYWNWFTYASFAYTTTLQPVHEYDEEWRRAGGRINPQNDALRDFLTEYIRHELSERSDLVDKCIPPYAPLGRRLIVDNGFYRALNRPNVELETGGISRITANGVVGSDGVERQFDVIILATGFEATQYFWPVRYRGRDGMTLQDLWDRDGARSYLGIAMPGFPNLFTMFGPGSAPRAGGFYSWAEIWARYAASAMVALIEQGKSTIEVRRDVFDDYNQRQDEMMKKIIWEHEAAGSWYLNEHGRAGVSMPWPVDEYHDWMRTPNLADYVVR